jgi:hypothetical protein
MDYTTPPENQKERGKIMERESEVSAAVLDIITARIILYTNTHAQIRSLPTGFSLNLRSYNIALPSKRSKVTRRNTPAKSATKIRGRYW